MKHDTVAGAPAVLAQSMLILTRVSSAFRAPAHSINFDRSCLQGTVLGCGTVRCAGSHQYWFRDHVRSTDEIRSWWAGAFRPQRPRLLFYGHYDVQPVDPLDLWEAPPFARTRDGRQQMIVARGACDDKGQVMTFIEACRAYRRVRELPLPITAMIEGEEECGSNHLFGFVKQHADELKLDLALVCDTSMWIEHPWLRRPCAAWSTE
jgi:acetylornithine deacetylase/succinyl-diaminopimelate desuccinylase-like protein